MIFVTVFQTRSLAQLRHVTGRHGALVWGSQADDCKTPGESQSPGDKALAAPRCPVTGLSVQDRNNERQLQW